MADFRGCFGLIYKFICVRDFLLVCLLCDLTCVAFVLREFWFVVWFWCLCLLACDGVFGFVFCSAA